MSFQLLLWFLFPSFIRSSTRSLRCANRGIKIKTWNCNKSLRMPFVLSLLDFLTQSTIVSFNLTWRAFKFCLAHCFFVSQKRRVNIDFMLHRSEQVELFFLINIFHNFFHSLRFTDRSDPSWFIKVSARYDSENQGWPNWKWIWYQREKSRASELSIVMMKRATGDRG